MFEKIKATFGGVVLFELVVTAILLVVVFVKGMIVGLMDGHDIIKAVVVCGGMYTLVPIVLINLVFLFTMMFPRILRIIMVCISLPFIWFFIFLTFPAYGKMEVHPWDEMTEVEQYQLLVIESETRLNIARKDPTSPEANTVRLWESANEQPYQNHINEYRRRLVIEQSK